MLKYIFLLTLISFKAYLLHATRTIGKGITTTIGTIHRTRERRNFR